MNQEEKANELIHKFRIELMDSDSDFGEEIIVSVLSQKFALICVDEVLGQLENMEYEGVQPHFEMEEWQGVKKHLLKLKQ